MANNLNQQHLTSLMWNDIHKNLPAPNSSQQLKCDIKPSEIINLGLLLYVMAGGAYPLPFAQRCPRTKQLRRGKLAGIGLYPKTQLVDSSRKQRATGHWPGLVYQA